MSRHFSAIPHCSWGAGHRKKYTPRNQCRYHSLQLIDNKISGGEGEIRTLGTGVSPYNGLANSARPLPIARNQSHTIGSEAATRTESECSAAMYAPQYAPLPEQLTDGVENWETHLISCLVAELRPHPSYARHKLSVDGSKLSALTERGDLAFCDPIVITPDR